MRVTAFNVKCCGLWMPLTRPVTLQRTAGDPHMAEQSVSLDGVGDVSPGAPNASAEGGDPVGDVVAIIGPRTTLASARDPETVLYRVKHEQRRSKPLRSNNPLRNFFMVYLKDSLPGTAVGKLCEANGNFANAEARSGSLTYLRQHLDTKKKGQSEALKQHGARGAGSKGGGSSGASSEKDAESIILPTWTASSYSRARLFGSSWTALIIDGLGLAVVIDASISRKVGRDTNIRITSRRVPRHFLPRICFPPLSG